MQPPPLPETFEVAYQVPRAILAGIWWRQWMSRPRRLASLAALVLLGGLGLVIGGELKYIGLFCLALVMFSPLSAYRAITKAVDGNAQFTDPKTLEFGPASLVVSGPNWKSELAWTAFKRFSEDANYFYLFIQGDFPSALPKTAFSAEAAQKFREYASDLAKKP